MVIVLGAWLTLAGHDGSPLKLDCGAWKRHHEGRKPVDGVHAPTMGHANGQLG